MLEIGLLSMMIYDPSVSFGLITPVKMLINVVFPAPLCPRMPISSFASIYSVKFLKASTLWLENRLLKVLQRFFILKPKAGIPFFELKYTFCLYLQADSYSY
jgi:hypothetical protein